MKNIILILAALLIFPSCKENNNTKAEKMSNLTSKNYIETMINVIKHYNHEPMYQLLITNNWCSSEILVNDIPVYKNFKEPLAGPTVDINNYIFRSGVQTVTVRLYPVGKYKDEDIKTFIAGTGISITINEYDIKTEKDKEIIKYTTPIKKERDKYGQLQFEGIGKTYYEASFTFDATVPYEFNSMDKAEDLRKLNPEVLEKKVVAFYKNQWNIIYEKKVDDFFSYLYLKESESSQSTYDSRAELEENLQAYVEPFTNETFKLEPLENYKLKLYGDGKIVCLELTSLDSKMRGKSALWGKLQRDGLRAIFRNYFLYIPEGKNEFEILR